MTPTLQEIEKLMKEFALYIGDICATRSHKLEQQVADLVIELQSALAEKDKILEPLKCGDVPLMEFKELFGEARKSPTYWIEYCKDLADLVHNLKQHSLSCSRCGEHFQEKEIEQNPKDYWNCPFCHTWQHTICRSRLEPKDELLVLTCRIEQMESANKQLQSFLSTHAAMADKSSKDWANATGNQSPQASYRSGMCYAFEQVKGFMEKIK